MRHDAVYRSTYDAYLSFDLVERLSIIESRIARRGVLYLVSRKYTSTFTFHLLLPILNSNARVLATALAATTLLPLMDI